MWWKGGMERSPGLLSEGNLPFKSQSDVERWYFFVASLTTLLHKHANYRYIEIVWRLYDNTIMVWNTDALGEESLLWFRYISWIFARIPRIDTP